MFEILAKLKTPYLLDDPRAKMRCLEYVLNGIAGVNLEYLKAFPNTPKLYYSGIVYRDDGDKKYDDWCDIPTVLQQGWGDCDDLVPWRLAELWMMGYQALPMVTIADQSLMANGRIRTLFHTLIRFPQGGTEDPSRKLGMR